MIHPKTLIIGGTTASGKSGLALALAERHGGVIVNADSVQLFKDLPLLTARPAAADEQRVRHELYGILGPTENPTAAFWLAQAQAKIDAIQRSGQTAIIVGGTGLYLMALLQGLAPVPEIDPNLRERVRQQSSADIDRQLCQLDPQADQRLSPNDRQRRLRALEVVLATGRPLVEWQALQPPTMPNTAQLMALIPPRAAVRARAAQRIWKMIERGVRAEVAELCHRVGDPRAMPIGKTLGLGELMQLEAGTLTLDAAVARIAIRTGQYAKRQETWFRRQLPEMAVIGDFGHSLAAQNAATALLA